MEVYLNVIEMGDGLYGAQTATQHYYKKSATKLSKREAALLIAVLPNPRRWTPRRPTAYVYQKQFRILQNMKRIKSLKFK